MKMSDGGKGSSPRKQQDQESYAKNWDAIFGKTKKPVEVPLALKDWSYEASLEKSRLEQDLCPKCGNEDWDTIAWGSMSGVSPFETYRSCQCGHEWSVKE